MYRLYWRGRELGTVSGVVGEFPWMHGDFTPTAVDPALREFFDFMSGEDPGDPPFDEALLDEGNWWLVEPDGKKETPRWTPPWDVPGVTRFGLER